MRPKERIRILLGHEPLATPYRPRPAASTTIFADDIRDYWLSRGISLQQCHDVIQSLEALQRDTVEVRISSEAQHPVHAKIYVTESVVVAGSSNFSNAGLRTQLEHNWRLLRGQRGSASLAEPQVAIAEQFWSMGKPFTEGLSKLLMDLLHEVSWQEALARGCAEILEGKWARRYLASLALGETSVLWPYQIEGVAQALYLAQKVGGVLVADATGSGKTRQGAALIKALLQRIWAQSGRLRNDMPVVLCPPKVVGDWKDHAATCGVALTIFSHGAMSRTTSDEFARVSAAVRRAQILAIDEAHNFLNRLSQRSQLLLENIADYVLLFTATPVNRGPADLLRVMNLLGADNFDDETLQVMETVLGAGPGRRRTFKPVGPETVEALRRSVQQFTLRRTKPMLNARVAEEPERYRDAAGRICRYPRHEAESYACDGDPKDRAVARLVSDLASQLKGIVRLRSSFIRPAYSPLTDQQYLEQRLRGAGGLAAYMVMDALRSSRAALLEHLYGTAAAAEMVGITVPAKEPTGNVIATLREIAGSPPENKLTDASLPSWLVEPDAHRAACEAEIAIYKYIGDLVSRDMTTTREETKAAALRALRDQHDRILAFDRHLITLYDLARRLESDPDTTVLVATGATPAVVKRLQRHFRPARSSEIGEGDETDGDLAGAVESRAGGKIIALCSDALSEGVNLQRASAVVHLDFPTVALRVEQRIGRVERMDSQHETIRILWPRDSQEFAAYARDRFFDRNLFISAVLGSNVILPDDLVDPARFADDAGSTAPITVEQVMREWEQGDDLGADQDAFSPIRDLVSGASALIPEHVYAAVRTSKAHVLSAVSVVTSETPWAFFVIADNDRGAPMLVYLDNLKPDTAPITRLDLVAAGIRRRLDGSPRSRKIDAEVGALVPRFLANLAHARRALLPRRKQRALAEMEAVLADYVTLAAPVRFEQPQPRRRGRPPRETVTLPRSEEDLAADTARAEISRQLLEVLQPLAEVEEQGLMVDLEVLAERWVDTVRPVWLRFLSQPQSKRRIVQLRHIRPLLLTSDRLSADDLSRVLNTDDLWMPVYSTRVAAAIIGAPLPPDSAASGIVPAPRQ